MVDVQKLIQKISEEIARDLIEQRGKSVSEQTIAVELANAVEKLQETHAQKFIDLIKGYVLVADVSVGIPTWRLNPDGTEKTKAQLEKELDF